MQGLVLIASGIPSVLVSISCPVRLVLEHPVVVVPALEFTCGLSSMATLQLAWSWMAEALTMAVIGPSTALAKIEALALPVTRTSSSAASRMVPTPMVRARSGTSSSRPPNIAAFCWRVVGVSVLSRVRERNAESGSLKPIWPASPMPSSWRSMPPLSRIRPRSGRLRP